MLREEFGYFIATVSLSNLFQDILVTKISEVGYKCNQKLGTTWLKSENHPFIVEGNGYLCCFFRQRESSKFLSWTSWLLIAVEDRSRDTANEHMPVFCLCLVHATLFV